MSVIHLEPEESAEHLVYAIAGLRRRDPMLSAWRLLHPRQEKALAGLAAVVLIALVVAFVPTLVTLFAFATVLYVITLAYRVYLCVLSVTSPSVVDISDAEARAIPDSVLPVYTVLVPAYNEPEVIAPLIANLTALEYPADRLDIKLLLEADDRPTIDAALSAPGSDRVSIVLLPPCDPRTKPKALNYGLCLAQGEYVTIFDAEDRPDPLQLRRAAAAFTLVDPDVACFQAKLAFGNAEQNMITRWFTTEYVLWFSLFLPGLVRAQAPLPLGGTSNHFRRDVLEQIGGWDAWNVTEDADLGIRLHREGWKTGVLESTTIEEANSDFVNWIKQRSRWYKGYAQTWLVNLRNPIQLERALGWKGFLQFNFFVGGTPLLALLNPLFWLLTIIWFIGQPPVIRDLFPAPVYYTALSCWAFGNFTIAYMAILGSRRTGKASLVLAACLTPLYWIMMSIAATKAFWQLITAPSFWEKTAHGLDSTPKS